MHGLCSHEINLVFVKISTTEAIQNKERVKVERHGLNPTSPTTLYFRGNYLNIRISID